MGARGRTTADGSVVLNLHRGAGAFALLARTDGQLTRAGQHYYSHLGLRPPTKDFDYNQPLIREGPNDYILLRNGPKKLVRSLEGDGEHRLTKLGKAFFRDKCYEYLAHVPVVIRGRRRSGRNVGAAYERKDWLPINELGGAMLPPVVEWKRFDPALPLEPGLFWCEDLREARRDLMAAGESPKVTLSSPSQYSGLRLRCGVRIRELQHELLRRWCEGLGQEYRGQRLAGLVFLKLLKAKREVPTAAQRQEVLAVQQGLCALCGCTVTQSACELDHVVPVRQLFADSVQRLQALCVDCHSEKTLRESAQPTSLESRVCPGVMEAYVRSPKLPPLVFEAQGSRREKPYVGVDVVRCRRNGLANAPFPLPILCPADGVEPVEPGRLPDLGYVEGCRDAR